MCAPQSRAKSRLKDGFAKRSWSSSTASIRSGTISLRLGSRKRRQQQILRFAQDDKCHSEGVQRPKNLLLFNDQQILRFAQDDKEGLTNPRDELQRALIIRRGAGEGSQEPPADAIHTAVEAGGGAAAGADWCIRPGRAAVIRVFDRGGNARGKSGRSARHLVLHAGR